MLSVFRNSDGSVPVLFNLFDDPVSISYPDGEGPPHSCPGSHMVGLFAEPDVKALRLRVTVGERTEEVTLSWPDDDA